MVPIAFRLKLKVLQYLVSSLITLQSSFQLCEIILVPANIPLSLSQISIIVQRSDHLIRQNFSSFLSKLIHPSKCTKDFKYGNTSLITITELGIFPVDFKAVKLVFITVWVTLYCNCLFILLHPTTDKLHISSLNFLRTSSISFVSIHLTS